MPALHAETSRCPHCAEALVPDVRFCNHCGRSVDAAPPKPSVIAHAPEWVRRWQQWVAKARRGWGLVRRYLIEEPNQQWWDVTAMLGGGVLGTLWMIYSKVRQSQGSFTTAIMIVALPIVMTKARKQLDEWLRPLQTVRRRMPQWVLIAAGVLAPFGITAILLQGGVRLLGISDQRCVQVAMLIGTSVAYALLRDPEEEGQAASTDEPPAPKLADPSFAGGRHV